MLDPLARTTYHYRTIALGADELPKEFRLFAAGTSDDLNGCEATFDAAAAAAVMARYRSSGARGQIDLEHDSLVDAPDAVREDMRDARGWFDLEVRSGPELWAVNVEWTPDGARRLQQKTQRYVSPAFTLDAKGRVNWLVNVALCARPATLGALPLVASQSPQGTTIMAKPKKRNMDPELAKKATAIIEGGDEKGAFELVKEMLAAAAAGGAMPAEEPAPEAATADGEEPEVEDPMAATVQAATAVASKATEIATRATAQVAELKAQVKRLTDVADATDAIERGQLVGRLVELRSETPATAYADAEKTKLVDRLANEPIATMRARVAELAKQAPPPPAKPPTTEVKARTFTPDELARASKAGLTPEQLAARFENAVRIK